MLKNLGVIKGIWGSVPIRVYDNGELWVYSGSMTAEIEGDVNTTTLTWVQLTGEPVTYTGPVNGLTITFTTTDLQSKVFRCYTNKGTPSEAYDDGTYYHHPIEVIVTNDPYDGTTSKLTNMLYPEDISYRVQGGMLSTYIDPKISGVIRLEGPVDEYTEFRITGLEDILVQFVEWTRIETATGGSDVWTVVREYDGFNPMVPALPQDADNYRVSFKHVWYGRVTILTWYRDDINLTTPEKGGSSRSHTNHISDINTLTSYQYLLQTTREDEYADFSDTSHSFDGAMTTTYGYRLQYINELYGSDLISTTHSQEWNTLTDYSYQLQTGTVVG